MGGVQVTVSWSTDGLVTIMFPTGPGEAGEEGDTEVVEGNTFIRLQYLPHEYSLIILTVSFPTMSLLVKPLVH